MKIEHLSALEILDSKGDPTLEVRVTLENGVQALGQVPSGASTGTHEATELRDGDQKRYRGKGVLKAVENVNTKLNQLLRGRDAFDQRAIDQLMIEADGTDTKSNLGGNALVGTSMAICRAAAFAQRKELYEYIGQQVNFSNYSLPQPQVLIMEGGKHGDWATDVQEFMIVPQLSSFSNFAEMLRASNEVFHTLGTILHKKGYDTGVGFEGAYAPKQIKSNQEAFELILFAVEEAGFKSGQDFKLAIDAAASEFFENNSYELKSENRQLTSEDWMEVVLEWSEQYPFWSIEDPFHESEWQTWQHFVKRIDSSIKVVGDDLVTTNVTRIQKAIELKAMNATLIKLNQIGTVSETLDAIKLSQQAGFATIISHRGGETNDDFIADLVVGTAAEYSKFGGPDRGERLAKYNRLLRIEAQLSERS